MDIFRLFGRIAVENDDANNAIDDTTGRAEESESRMSGAFKKIGAAVATYFAADKIINFGKQAVDAAATVSAEASAFEQIMGNYSDTAQRKMNEIADNTGMLASRLTPYMTSLTAKFKGLGFDIGDATDLASDGLIMAADAAAFWDMSLDESVSHLNSFVNGSYEGGEAIGLFANDTQMASYAVKTGLIDETKEWASLDEKRKQATRLEYAQNMMEASGAVGQAAKESSQYANVQANLTEKWRQFKAQIGEPLLQNVVNPAMEKLSGLVDTASTKFQDLQKWVSENKTLLENLAIVLGSVAAAILLYNTYQGIATALTTAKAAADAAGATSLWAYAAAQAAALAPVIGIVAAIAAVIAIIVLLVKNWDKVKEVAINVWNKVKEIWRKVADWFKTTVVEPIKNVFNGLKDGVSKIWEGIKNVISVAFQAIVNIFKFWIDLVTLPWRLLWEGIKLLAEVIWNAIGDKVTSAINKIKEVITVVMTAIKEFFTNVWDGIKTIFTTVWNAIYNFVSPIIEKIKTVISTVFNTIKTFIQNVVNGWKTIFTTVWNAIYNFISPIVNKIKEVISTVFNAIKNTISNILGGIKNTVSKIFNGIKDTIDNVINGAKNIVSNGIDAIKGFFDKLKIKFPNIKLPHFSIKGEFSLDPPSVPSLGIDWYAKGGVMNEPTAFGINPKSGRVMVGGEAGAEAIAPIDTLLGYIRTAVQEENSNVAYLIERLISMLAEFLPEIVNGQGRKVVLSTGETVGALAPYMDEKLGEINSRKGRGN